MSRCVHASLGWVLCALLPAAEPVETVSISADGSHQQPGCPISQPLVHALAGKPMQLRWKAPAGAAPSLVTVDQVTAARRLALDQGQATVDEHGWVWEWTPPETRGAVTYEVKLEALEKLVVKLQVRDAAGFKQMSEKLATMTWQAGGLNDGELDALAALGITRIDDARNARSGMAFLRLIADDQRATRRELLLNAKDADRVVWGSGDAQGDVRVLVPRWWISAEALATDHGRVRFYDLFSTAPIILRQP